MYNNGYSNGNMNPNMSPNMNQQYNVAPNYGPQGYVQPDPYNAVPPYYRPIKPWGYIGYMLLYGIPIVGIIMLIVNACSTDNINKRNFARSYLWLMLVSLIISIIVTIFAIILGVIAANANY